MRADGAGDFAFVWPTKTMSDQGQVYFVRLLQSFNLGQGQSRGIQKARLCLNRQHAADA